MEAATVTSAGRGDRSLDERSSRSRLADPAFRWTLTILAGGILALIALFSVTYPTIARYAAGLVRFLSMLGRNSLYVFCVGSVLLALLPLAMILFFVVSQGLQGLNLEFFVGRPKPVGEVGGGSGRGRDRVHCGGQALVMAA